MLDQTDISRPTATRSQVTPPDPVSVRQAEWVNDIHSGLNATRVSRVEQPDATTRLQTTIKKARVERKAISIAAGKGAMGGQQFGTDSILFDMNNLNQVVSFDPGAGLVTVSAGIQWPELIGFLSQAQVGQQSQWAIKQKQTGADRLSIGGTLPLCQDSCRL